MRHERNISCWNRWRCQFRLSAAQLQQPDNTRELILLSSLCGIRDMWYYLAKQRSSALLESAAVSPTGWDDDLFRLPLSAVKQRYREVFFFFCSLVPSASWFIAPFHKQVFWILMIDLVSSSMLRHARYRPAPAVHLRKQPAKTKACLFTCT